MLQEPVTGLLRGKLSLHSRVLEVGLNLRLLDVAAPPVHSLPPHCFSSLLACCCLPSSLFPDVVNCMQTDNLELKKLVYLYLMNYAKSQPDMAIMAVNSFVKVKLAPTAGCASARGVSPYLLFQLAFLSCSLPLLLCWSLWAGGLEEHVECSTSGSSLFLGAGGYCRGEDFSTLEVVMREPTPGFCFCC